MTATATNPAGPTVAATAHLTRGHIPMMAVTGDTDMAAPPTDATVTTPPLITTTAHLIALLTAPLTALLTALLTATGPPTALITSPLDAVPTPQTPIADIPPQRDRAAATRNPMGACPY